MSDLTQMIVSTITSATERANAIADKVAAATTNVNKQIRDLRQDEDTTDAKVQAYQKFVEDLDAKREAATKQIDEYLAEQIGATKMSDEERDALRDEYNGLRDEVRTAEKLLRMQPGGADVELPALNNFSGRKSSSSGTVGWRRPRLSADTVNGEDIYVTKKNKDGEDVRSVTFTVLAQHITKDSGTKVTPRELQEVAFEEAGTTDLSTVKEVTFGYSADGNNYEVTVFPKGSDDDE